MDDREIVVAILAKDKGYCLDLYLNCLHRQTYPKDKIHLYIRTNDNKDNTTEILDKWVDDNGGQYASVHYDKSPIDEGLKKYGEHEWNSHRFSILGAIRQASVDYAKEKNVHYFTADCDNFLVPETLERLWAVRHLGVISPLLDTTIRASNLHHCCDPVGYYKECDHYDHIRFKKIRGIQEVGVAHCSYLFPRWMLNSVKYNDGSGHYEYVIVAKEFRNCGIKQYMDSTIDYGFLEHAPENYKRDLFNVWIKRYPQLFL
jgi:hypothetical protein